MMPVDWATQAAAEIADGFGGDDCAISVGSMVILTMVRRGFEELLRGLCQTSSATVDGCSEAAASARESAARDSRRLRE